MSLTTIPITFYLSFEQPAGVTMVPQVVGGLEETWRYTDAPNGGDRSVGFNPRVSIAHDAAPADTTAPERDASVETNATDVHASVETNATNTHAEIAALRRAELDQFLSTMPASSGITESELKTLSAHFHEQLQADLDRQPTAADDAAQSNTVAALVGRLQAEIQRLEDEAVQLRDELTRLSARSVGFNPRTSHKEGFPTRESNGHASAETGATDATHASVKTNATNGHAAAEANATADPDDDEVAPDVVGDNPTEKLLSPRHQIALEMLLSGSTIGEIAAELKVDSSTVGRWMRKPNFVARYNRHMREWDHSVHRKLQTICDTAVEVTASYINSGNLRAALQVLKGRGFLSGQTNELVPILETKPVAPPAAAPEPAPLPPFPQRGSLNGHAIAG